MLVFAIFSAVLGMFQFGFNTGVINAPQEILTDFIADVYKQRTAHFISSDLLDLIWSITVSIFAVGGMIGGLFGGTIADWCGRKCGLLLNNAIAIFGATLMSSSQLFRSIECLIIGRFFIGINCGLNTHLVPMYLSEIAPMNLRGALGTVAQLGVTIGLLLSQVLGLPHILGTSDGWPFLLGVAFVPAVLQLLLLPFCPESPRYLLITKGRTNEARHALTRLRCTSDVDDDMEEMRMEESRASSESSDRRPASYGTDAPSPVHDVSYYQTHPEDLNQMKYAHHNNHLHQQQDLGAGSTAAPLDQEPNESSPSSDNYSVWAVICSPDLRMPLIIAIVMQLSQQLSGINAIFFYSTDIFKATGLDSDQAKGATIGVGCVMVVMTLVSIPMMDKMGRRTLHLWGQFHHHVCSHLN
jgi:MFS family permease